MKETANEGSGVCTIEGEGRRRGTRGFSEGQVNYPAVAEVLLSI